MDEETRKFVVENLELARENNRLLQQMRRSQKISSAMRVLYWLVILGASIGAFYAFQPYLDQLKNVYGGANDVLQGFQQIVQ
jgi:hypothetical protein